MFIFALLGLGLVAVGINAKNKSDAAVMKEVEDEKAAHAAAVAEYNRIMTIKAQADKALADAMAVAALQAQAMVPATYKSSLVTTGTIPTSPSSPNQTQLKGVSIRGDEDARHL